MGNLYNQLAAVYEAMYQTFIDYKAEYEFYSELLLKYKKNEVVEIGCGTGNLVPYFLENNFNYIGLDLSENMIEIAKNKIPNGDFRIRTNDRVVVLCAKDMIHKVEKFFK